MLEQIECQRPRRDEEDENPDRPVVESVIQLVALTNLAFGGVLNWNRRHGPIFLSERGHLTQLRQHDPRGNSKVQRVNRAGDRNPYALIRSHERFIAEAFAFSSDQECDASRTPRLSELVERG